MTNPTRQEMLDSITHKIAHTGGGTGPGETGYFLPVMIGDCIDYFESIGHKVQYSDLGEIWSTPSRILKVLLYWKTKRETLSAQDDDCITYIYNLISNAK